MTFRKRGMPDVICLPDGPVGLWEKRRSAKSKARMASVAVGGSVALAGCTTFGTNISGDFACKAPDGTCAPSLVIDDRALAMISGGSVYQPAGPYPVTPSRSGPRMTSAAPLPLAARTPVVRTDQKVLTVVFPAHVDARGRLFEATTVRTVVDNGSWAVASASDPVRAIGIPAEVSALVTPPVTFGEVEPVDGTLMAYDLRPPPLAADPTPDPDVPSSDAVAEARARGAAKAVPALTASVAAAIPVNAPRGFAATVED